MLLSHLLWVLDWEVTQSGNVGKINTQACVILKVLLVVLSVLLSHIIHGPLQNLKTKWNGKFQIGREEYLLIWIEYDNTFTKVWTANQCAINNIFYTNAIFKRWQRQIIRSFQHWICFSRDLHSGSWGKGRKTVKVWAGYLVGWGCENCELMQKGAAHIRPFMKLGESVTFIPIHTLSYIFGHESFLYHFKDFSPCVFSKEAWVPGVLWGK